MNVRKHVSWTLSSFVGPAILYAGHFDLRWMNVYMAYAIISCLLFSIAVVGIAIMDKRELVDIQSNMAPKVYQDLGNLIAAATFIYLVFYSFFWTAGVYFVAYTLSRILYTVIRTHTVFDVIKDASPAK